MIAISGTHSARQRDLTARLAPNSTTNSASVSDLEVPRHHRYRPTPLQHPTADTRSPHLVSLYPRSVLPRNGDGDHRNSPESIIEIPHPGGVW